MKKRELGMKAIVVELKNEFAAVLSDDGCVITVKNNNYEIGQIIQIKKQRVQIYKKISMFAASAAAFVILGTSVWAYASPYTYVSLDVNPSIEFTVNRFDRVIQVRAVNDDGSELLSGIEAKELVNKAITGALTTALDQIIEAGYIDHKTENGIVIAASSKNSEKAGDLVSDLKEAVDRKISEEGNIAVVEAFSVASNRVDEAKELGITPGKLNLVEKLKEAAGTIETVDINEWLDKSVKDIMKATKEYAASAEEGKNNMEVPAEEDNTKKDTTVEDENVKENHNDNDSRTDIKPTEDTDKKYGNNPKNTNTDSNKNNKKYDNATVKNSYKSPDKASQAANKQTDSNKSIPSGKPATITPVPSVDPDVQKDTADKASGKSQDRITTAQDKSTPQNQDVNQEKGDSQKDTEGNSQRDNVGKSEEAGNKKQK